MSIDFELKNTQVYVVKVRGMDIVEVLSFLFMLSTMELGQVGSSTLFSSSSP